MKGSQAYQTIGISRICRIAFVGIVVTSLSSSFSVLSPSYILSFLTVL